MFVYLFLLPYLLVCQHMTRGFVCICVYLILDVCFSDALFGAIAGIVTLAVITVYDNVKE